jgi:hypothetical protein
MKKLSWEDKSKENIQYVLNHLSETHSKLLQVKVWFSSFNNSQDKAVRHLDGMVKSIKTIMSYAKYLKFGMLDSDLIETIVRKLVSKYCPMNFKTSTDLSLEEIICEIEDKYRILLFPSFKSTSANIYSILEVIFPSFTLIEEASVLCDDNLKKTMILTSVLEKTLCVFTSYLRDKKTKN